MIEGTLIKKSTNANRNTVALSTFFFLNGFILASWIARIGDKLLQIHINKVEFGIILLLPAIGSLIGFPLSGTVARFVHPRAALLLFSILYILLFNFIGVSGSLWSFGITLFFYGVVASIFNIIINNSAVTLEKWSGKSKMNTMHGMFSLGTIAGAAVAGIFISKSIALTVHFYSISLFSILLVLRFNAAVLPGRADTSQKIFSFRWDKAVIQLGLIAACILFSEGAIADWSTVYFKEYIPDKSFTTAGYTTFTVTMTLARFRGDWIRQRIGNYTTIILGCLVTCTGLLMSVCFLHPVVMMAGFGLAGMGLSTITPILYSMAGSGNSSSPHAAIATLGSVAFIGQFIGPTAIGVMAEEISLRYAFLLIPVCCLVALFIALRLKYSNKFNTL